MPAEALSSVRVGRGQLPASASTRCFPAAARPDHAGGALWSPASAAPPGHSQGVLIRCRAGKGDIPAMAAATTRFSGRAKQRLREC